VERYIFADRRLRRDRNASLHITFEAIVLHGERIDSDYKWRKCEASIAPGFCDSLDTSRILPEMNGSVGHTLLLSIRDGTHDGACIDLGKS
jgi:hypothetical protein